jgi:hypothetical protein
MARRRRKANMFPAVLRCRRCQLWRAPDERFYRGLCSSCRKEKAKARRAATGARILAKAKDAGTLERDGQQFRVVALPPKRRRSLR